jgi:5-formyltetrahydrofolate cyclo-ligase
MDEIREKKVGIRNDMVKMIEGYSDSEREAKTKQIEDRLFDFANFIESRIPLLYVDLPTEVPTENIIRRCFTQNKIVILPVFDKDKKTVSLWKVDNFDQDLKPGPRGVLEPVKDRCKKVPLDRVDIAIVPGYAFDEKGGRIGSGNGYYDWLIPELSATTRKVALSFEEQIIPQIPMESHDKFVDIIVSDQRIIYKI